MTDCWNPSQYEKFRAERELPFFDLLSLVHPVPGMRAIDLGCGTGQQTRILHERVGARETIGLDRSARMLERAPAGIPGLTFQQGTIEEFAGDAEWDLVFSNAALHWIEGHDELVPRLARALRSGGQLAFQVPAMHDAFAHLIARELTAAEPFRAAFGGWQRPQPVLTPEQYALLLHRAGFPSQHVRLVIYPHLLGGPDEVVEWMKGTLLTEYERHLPDELRPAFVEAFRERLLARMGQDRPFFFPFRRILCWAQL